MVSLWDRDAGVVESAAAELSSNEKVYSVTVDISNADEAEAATAATVEALGGIDILVANAGITGPNLKLWDYPPDEWQQVMAVNLNGVFLLPIGSAADDPTELWAHRERGVDRRQGRESECLGVQRV